MLAFGVGHREVVDHFAFHVLKFVSLRSFDLNGVLHDQSRHHLPYHGAHRGGLGVSYPPYQNDHFLDHVPSHASAAEFLHIIHEY